MSKKVYLDPGHGGHDPGAQGNGLREKDLVLDISLKTQDILRNQYEGVSVRMSRTDDTFIELNERARDAVNWDADLFVSIHLNGAAESANGTETFMHSNSSASATARKNLHDAIFGAMRRIEPRVTDRGLKSANFAVLRGTYRDMLSVLTEALFITNPRDASMLKKSGTIDRIAEAHVEGIAKTLGLKKKSTPSAETVSSSTSFTSMSNSDKYKEMLIAVEDQGFEFEQFQRLLLAVGEQLPRFRDDGYPGAETLSATEAFQTRYNVSSPNGNFFGRPGEKTFETLLKNLPSFNNLLRANRPYPRGEDVRCIQRAVNSTDDGIYGPNTAGGVRDMQRKLNISVDGVFGPQTRKAMFNL
ncbi:N-acetylmuramoyl-L-alanine amidase [Salipaludibacillus aurantiacus]|uniref:N-acetylmuramoyl-L-alanine amidase n=1 Tax=Salipaludibacillus aurantiacus TaxID=1601833 RepID=A0A1H9TZT6_9BACI|nr:N-acetylmuramoyl-L-alanine amidase [Salipaludibacillus aurantiacus]SES02404.1 N-acetylmuramoyl-L-alanine amidase [Salipaludibacillus aurantiacus]